MKILEHLFIDDHTVIKCEVMVNFHFEDSARVQVEICVFAMAKNEEIWLWPYAKKNKHLLYHPLHRSKQTIPSINLGIYMDYFDVSHDQ